MAQLPTLLPPTPSLLGILHPFSFPVQKTLVLKDESGWLGASETYGITDVDTNVVVLQCKSEGGFFAMPLGFWDGEGKEVLFTLRNAKGWHVERKWEGVRTGEMEDVLFEVSVKESLLKGSRMVMTFTNAVDGLAVELVERGDSVWSHRHATIMWNDKVVAQVEKRYILNEGSHIFGKQGYMVSIAPGVDVALIAAMCIAMDNNEKEKAVEAAASAS